MNTVQINAALATDVGLSRRLNEDSGIAEQPVFAVADGMGGHDSGEAASAIVIDRLRALAMRAADSVVTADAVVQSLRTAHEQVAALSASRSHGAGSTVSGVALVESEGVPNWLVFNVGDSRVYRSRNGSLVQWTHDHSLLQQWLDDGTITPEQAAQNPRGNEITKAVGAENSDPDFFLSPVVNGERLLICSDGLHGLVGAEALRASLVMGGTPKSTAESLVERALVAGGTDNVTVVVVDVISGGALKDPEAPSESLASLGDATVRHDAARRSSDSAEIDDTRYVSRARRSAQLRTDADETRLISSDGRRVIDEGVTASGAADETDDDTVSIDRTADVTVVELLADETVIVPRRGSDRGDAHVVGLNDDTVPIAAARRPRGGGRPDDSLSL